MKSLQALGVVVSGSLILFSGCDQPSSDTTKMPPAIKTRKTIGKTTQNVLELSEALRSGGILAEMSVTADGLGMAADVYRTSVGTLGVQAVEHKMQLHAAEHGSVPATYTDFMAQISEKGKPNGVELPMLPYYQEYAFDSETKKLVVIEFPAKKEQRLNETTGAAGL